MRQLRKDGDLVVSVGSKEVKVSPSFLTLCPEADKTKLDNSNVHDRPRSKREHVSGLYLQQLTHVIPTDDQ